MGNPKEFEKTRYEGMIVQTRGYRLVEEQEQPMFSKVRGRVDLWHVDCQHKLYLRRVKSALEKLIGMHKAIRKCLDSTKFKNKYDEFSVDEHRSKLPVIKRYDHPINVI